ncbi:MAG: hypothetical protein MUC50_17970, partial [Myxococcota bacterium]|nr:hypothetical protein [Myxococcota bacterium]
MHLADELRAFELMEMARTTSPERLAVAYPHPFLLGEIDEADSRDEFFTSHRPSSPPANIADAPPFR